MRRSVLLAAGGGLLALTGALVSPAATAAPLDAFVIQSWGKDNCQEGYVCLYEDWHFNRNQKDWKILLTRKDLGNLGGDFHMDDRTSAVFNNSDRTVKLYPGKYHMGVPLTVGPREAFDFTNDDSLESDMYNDKYSSLKFTTGGNDH
ncbi:peptidase inhibitor family I36 protein [Streptomyces sp. NPDC006610]|uniref:peptidase inhibitor family I36 protein n=1 Tax=Streptomyces sp. NPDC006610 TaxID=3154584 RepID=UPI0033B745A6